MCLPSAAQFIIAEAQPAHGRMRSESRHQMMAPRWRRQVYREGTGNRGGRKRATPALLAPCLQRQIGPIIFSYRDLHQSLVSKGGLVF